MDANYAIGKARELDLIKRVGSMRNGRYHAKISAEDPISCERYNRRMSGEDEASLHEKATACELELYRLIRPSFLRGILQTEDQLSLKKYLELDFEFLAENWPKRYNPRKFGLLFKFADGFDRDLGSCTNADDIIPAVRELELSRSEELDLLRMLRDVMQSLIFVGLCQPPNPLERYYKEARAVDNREKREKRETRDRVLSEQEISLLGETYYKNRFLDARYLAIPLRMIGMDSDEIAGLNLENDIQFFVHCRMVKNGNRYRREKIENPWHVRLLPVQWMREELRCWESYYQEQGIEEIKGVPTCAYGRRKHPKRCTPEEIESFLQSVLDRVTLHNEPEVRPTVNGAKFKEIRKRVDPKSLETSFRHYGHETLEKKLFFARYILGDPEETVDEKNYVDAVHPSSQLAMSEMIQEIMLDMGFRRADDEC